MLEVIGKSRKGKLLQEESINKNLILLRQWVVVSFGYLLLVGVLGVFLRFIVVYPIEGIVFRNFLHAHSHIAFLGWVFNALFAGIVYAFIPSKAASYKWLFILLQLNVVGMLISFPIQGYAFWSISSSTLHIFLSWWFAAKVFRHLKENRLDARIQNHTLSRSFIKWSLFFMVLSAAGPFALGGIMAKELAATNWYQLSIYFYLHFQYDGWFTFALFGLFFWMLERNNILFNRTYCRIFVCLMALACIPAYSLSALWTEPATWVYVVAGISSAIQLLALLVFLLLLWRIKQPLGRLFKGSLRLALTVSLVAFMLKVLLQMASALPEIARLAYLVRSFTIGYLHLVFLGFVSFFLIAWFARQGFLQLHTRTAKWGILLFLAGFIMTELYLIAQPLLYQNGWTPLPAYELSLMLLSLLLPAGTALLLGNLEKVSVQEKEVKKGKFLL